MSARFHDTASAIDDDFAPRLLPGSTSTAARTCPGSIRARRIACGCPKSCCSRPRCARSFRTFCALSKSCRRSLRSPRRRSTTCWRSGPASATTAARATCIARRSSASSDTAATCRAISTRSPPCPASAARPPARSWRKRTACASRSSTATSSACSRAGAASRLAGRDDGQARIVEIRRKRTRRETRLADYTQAIMDLGATLCTRSRPRCAGCPLADDCVALREDLTAELPERKPARAIPTRQTIMLVLRDDQRPRAARTRPPTGVWAGLWSLPEAPTTTRGHARDRARADIAVPRIECHALPAFMHSFSHYRLRRHAARARTGARPPMSRRDDDRPRLAPRRRAARARPARAGAQADRNTFEDIACHAPCSASSSSAKPKGSRSRPSPASSANASTRTFEGSLARTGSRTRPC